MQEQNLLKSKTISGMFWSISDLMVNQGLQVIIQIFLARLIVPEDFGIIGMIAVFIALSQALVDGGLSNALIREKEVKQEDLSTVFFFNFFLACSLYVILFFSAKPISVFFHEPMIMSILRVLSLVIIVDAFGIIQRTIMVRKIDFRTQTKVNILSSVASGVLAIASAYFGFGVWSLVIRTLSMQFLQALLLCLYSKWIPSFVIKLDSLKKLFGYGWKLLASSLIDTLYNNIYYIIIGKYFSATELGYYTTAQRLRDAASQSLTLSVQKVSYPVLSSIQSDGDKLRSGFRKIIKNFMFITFPMMVGLIVVAAPLFNLLLGHNWKASIPYFQILCFAGMLFPLHVVNLNILQVKGRSDLFLKLEVIKKVIGIASITIVIVYGFGIYGLLWVAVINSYISYFINSYYSLELLGYSTYQQIMDILPSLIASILMGISVYLIGNVLPVTDLVELVLQGASGIIIYIGLCKIIGVDELQTCFDLISSILKRKVTH